MTYPFLKTILSELFHLTLVSDGEKKFYYRFVEPLTTMIVKYSGMDKSKFYVSSDGFNTNRDEPIDLKFRQAIIGLFVDLSIPLNSTIVISHSYKTKTINDVLTNGLYSNDLNFPIYSTIIGLTTNLNVVDPLIIDICFLDILECDNKSLMILDINARLSFLRTIFEKDNTIYHVSDGFNLCARLSDVMSASLFEICPAIESKMEDCGNVYSRIEVFGRKRYALKNSYLSIASKNTFIELFPNIYDNEREYQQELERLLSMHKCRSVE